MAKDQQLLSYLLNSITKDVLAQVATVTTSAEAWQALQIMFAAHSRAYVMNLCMQLATLKKGSIATSTYFNKMRAIKDELAAVGTINKMLRLYHIFLDGLDLNTTRLCPRCLGELSPSRSPSFILS